jgi:UDP-N-acetylmuramoyl-tripeptide--D-alanyl-D-alanine ligase
MSMSVEPLWSGMGLIGAAGARLSGPLPQGVSGVSIDTRSLEPGDLFVALKGDNSDGHEHVRAAFDKGAAAALVDEAHAGALAGAGALLVAKDTLRALEDIGKAARARSKARIVAVTGSVGKTSTKEALKLVLSRVGATHASVASYNNHWGVPLTLARMPADTRFGVFEIGMNHAGEITPLTGMVRPHIALITRVAPVHLEHFGTLEAIAEAKAEIFTGLAKGGVAILPRDDDQYDLLAQRAKDSSAGFTLSFGRTEGADARLLDVVADESGVDVSADILGKRIDYRIGAPGAHMALNTLGLLLAARAVGADVAAAAAALADYAPPSGRGARATIHIPGGAFTLIDESYNANPASMRAALDMLGATSGARKIAVLGDMLELGPTGEDLHGALAESIERNGVDLCFLAGSLMGRLNHVIAPEKRGSYQLESSALEPVVIDAMRPGDVVMVKGSLGSRMGRIVKALKALDAGVQVTAGE